MNKTELIFCNKPKGNWDFVEVTRVMLMQIFIQKYLSIESAIFGH